MHNNNNNHKSLPTSYSNNSNNSQHDKELLLTFKIDYIDNHISIGQPYFLNNISLFNIVNPNNTQSNNDIFSIENNKNIIFITSISLYNNSQSYFIVGPSISVSFLYNKQLYNIYISPKHIKSKKFISNFHNSFVHII